MTPENTAALIQVFDNAVKIGLGALIAAVASWLSARHTAKGALDKIRYEARLKTLQEVSEEVEQIFGSHRLYTSWLENSERLANTFPQATEQVARTVEKISISIESTSETIARSEARLLFLGEKTAAQYVRKMGEHFMFGLKLMPEGEVKNFNLSLGDKELIDKLRLAFYEEMQRATKRH